ncbi:MAG: hypothetical protein KKD44_25760 [Proteobacteria bacterium]|nr:hypothetical protein [Pseudomonadota bacterium]
MSRTLLITHYAEEFLLGSIMLASCYVEGGIQQYEDVLSSCFNLVKPSHFLNADNARIYKAMQMCKQPDILGVLIELEKNGQFQDNDRAYLRFMLDNVTTEFDLMHYAREVIGLWEGRTGKTNRRRGIAV